MKTASYELYRINLTTDYFCAFFIIFLEYAMSIVIISIVVIIIATKGYFNLDITLTILNIIILLQAIISSFLYYLIRFDCSFVSVQNLFELIASPKERNSHLKNDLKIIDGKIEFCNLTVKYKEKIALNNFSCKIEPGSKVAIIGRTGAGKSTIIKAILKLVNLASGTIFIDGQDYADYSPKCLRRLIATNPQTSLIFYGSIRQNLDPFRIHSNLHISYILLMLQLGTLSCADLDDESFGQSTNLSIGEKQLFCLARFLLKKGKIVLIDEPTSSVDSFSDKIIQDAIKDELKDCTILTISHREDLFRYYNYFLRIDNGELIEYGSIN